MDVLIIKILSYFTVKVHIPFLTILYQNPSNINSTFKSLSGLGLFGGVTLPDGSFTASIQHVHQSPEHRQRSSTSSVSSASSAGSSLLQPPSSTQALDQSTSNASSHSSSEDSTQSSSESSTSEEESTFGDFASMTTGESIFSQSQANLLQSEAINSLTNSLQNESLSDHSQGNQSRNFSITYRGSTLFPRLLRIVRRLEEMDKPQANQLAANRMRMGESRPHQTATNTDMDEYSLIVETSNMVEGLIERYRRDPASSDGQERRTHHSNTGRPSGQNGNSSLTTSATPTTPLDTFDYTRTFNRLSQLCHRLFNLVRNFYEPHTAPSSRSDRPSPPSSPNLDPVQMDESLGPHLHSLTIRPSSPLPFSNDESPRPSHIVALISRIQTWLQNEQSQTSEPLLSDQEMSQMRTHAVDVIDRLTSVTGIRDRLTILRSQIYDLFEQILLGDELDEQRNYLLHCLLLVLMCINLTKRMQRIYIADLRITQLTQLSLLNNHLAANRLVSQSGQSSPVDQRNRPEQASRPRKRPSDSDHFFSSSSSKRLTKDVSHTSSPSCYAAAVATPATAINQGLTTDSLINPIASTSSGQQSRAPNHARNRILSLTLPSPSPTSSFSTDLLRPATTHDEDFTTFDQLNSARSTPLSYDSSLPLTQRVFASDFDQLPSIEHPPGNRFFSFNPLYRSAPNQNNHFANAGQDSPAVAAAGLNGSWTSYADFTLLGGTDQNFNYRIQCWDFDGDRLPDLEDNRANLVVSRCRIQNDSSIEWSATGDLLACLVPVDGGSSGMNLCIYSLRRSSFAQCVYSWNFPSNAISVSLSQSGRFVLVGLSSPRVLSSYLTPPTDENLTIAHVFELRAEKIVFNQSWLSQGQDAGGDGLLTNCGNNNIIDPTPPFSTHSKNAYKDGKPPSKSPSFAYVRQKALKKVRAIQVPRGSEMFSINSIRWLPFSGDGFIYGTNKGQLVICRPKCAEPIIPALVPRYMHLIQVIESLQRASTGSYRQASSQSIGTQTTASAAPLLTANNATTTTRNTPEIQNVTTSTNNRRHHPNNNDPRS